MSKTRAHSGAALGRTEEERHAVASAWTREAPEAVTTLLALLGDSSWRVRKEMLARLRRIEAPETYGPELVRGLADPDNAGLRSACAEALSAMGEVVVPSLVAAVRSADADQRKFIVEVLGEVGGQAAREALLGLLDDADDNVRASVAAALGRLGGEATIKVLVERLQRRRGDVQLAAYALHALAGLEAKVSRAVLDPLLAEPGLERLVYPLLACSADASAAGPLLRAVASGSRGTRLVAIRALARLLRDLSAAEQQIVGWALAAEPGVTRRLQDALADGGDEMAESAVVLLGAMGKPELAPVILAAAASRPFVHAASEVVARGGGAIVPHLLDAFDAAGSEERVLFLELIERLGDESAAPRLLELARTDDGAVAEAAIRASGRLGDAKSVPVLAELAEHDDPSVAGQAARALCAVGVRHPAAVATAVRRALEMGDVHPGWFAVLASLGRDEDVDLVVAASHHRDAEVRRAAVEAFLSFRNRVDEEAVIRVLTDENARVRAAAARVLGAYRSPRSLDALLVAIRDTDSLVVGEALKSLGAVGGEKAETALRAAAASNAPPIVIAALEGLSRMSAKGLATAVAQALQHVDPEVVCEVIRVGAALEDGEAFGILERCLTHRSWHVRLAAVEALERRPWRALEERLRDCLHEEAEPLVRTALAKLLAQARTRNG